MRRFLLLCLFVLAALAAAPAHADRVMEVQNVKVEGLSSREAAVDEATRQAAQQVWSQLGRTTPLPGLSPAQLQGIASYVDVASEVARPNYYAGSFNVGIYVNALLRTGGGGSVAANTESAAPAGDAYRPSQPYQQAEPATHVAPDWVLVIAGREIARSMSLWNAADAWSQAWQRAPMTGISTAVATGDASDQSALPASQIQDYDPNLAEGLRRLARKYGAPAIALVVLSSQRAEIGLNEEVKVEVTYLEKDMPEVQTSESSVFITNAAETAPYATAVTEGQKLIGQLVNGSANSANAAQAAAQTLNYTGTMGTQAGQFGNTYSGSAAPPSSASKLWVRIPLSGPADLANYRRKIEAIPGARFEIIALNRMYVEGNILYSGDQNTLMQQLAAAGLRQQ